MRLQVGEPGKALDFYMIAAHLTPKDAGLWHRLATLSNEQGCLRQAIYCLGKARAAAPAARCPLSRAGALERAALLCLVRQ